MLSVNIDFRCPFLSRPSFLIHSSTGNQQQYEKNITIYTKYSELIIPENYDSIDNYITAVQELWDKEWNIDFHEENHKLVSNMDLLFV